MAEGWDFEGWVCFRTPEEGGRQTLPRMGYFPQLTYPDFKDTTHFLARPVAAFRADGTPYLEGEEFEGTIQARFWFVNRRLAERVHHPRLAPGVRFDLAEGARIVANGVVTDTNSP